MKTLSRFFRILAFLPVLGCKPGSPVMHRPGAVNDTLYIEMMAERFQWTARYAGADQQMGAFSYRCISLKNPTGADTTDIASRDDFTCTDTLYIPAGMTVRLEFHAKDVVHGVYLPQFRTSTVAVPGIATRITVRENITSEQYIQTHPEQEYLLLCNHICGYGHYGMTMVIRVVPQKMFEQWYQRRSQEINSGGVHSLFLPVDEKIPDRGIISSPPGV